MQCILLENYVYYVVQGEKAKKFLQGQLTCDLDLLTAAQALFGAYLTPKGRVITTLRIFLYQDQILLQLPADIADAVITRLQKVALLSRVKLLPETTLNTLGIYSENSEQQNLNLPASISKINLTSKIQMLIGPTIACAEILAAEKECLSYEAWQQLLILAKLVEVNAAISEQFTCHDIDLIAQQAISFTKGCYVGQEIVARMQYLGKLKSHLQFIQLAAPPIASVLAPVYNQKGAIVGKIIAASNINNSNFMLVLLQDQALDEPLSLISINT